MRRHPPKRVILIGIEKSKLLLGQNLASQAGQYILDETRLKELADEMRKDMKRLEKKRQGGFYVDVNSDDGRITSSPRRIGLPDDKSTMRKAEVFLRLGEALCEIFRDIEERPRTDVRLKKVILFKADEPDTITIVWDEI